jgi:hypothetical protein
MFLNQNCIRDLKMGLNNQLLALKEVAFIAGKSETKQPKKNYFHFSLII